MLVEREVQLVRLHHAAEDRGRDRLHVGRLRERVLELLREPATSLSAPSSAAPSRTPRPEAPRARGGSAGAGGGRPCAAGPCRARRRARRRRSPRGCRRRALRARRPRAPARRAWRRRRGDLRGRAVGRAVRTEPACISASFRHLQRSGRGARASVALFGGVGHRARDSQIRRSQRCPAPRMLFAGMPTRPICRGVGHLACGVCGGRLRAVSGTGTALSRARRRAARAPRGARRRRASRGGSSRASGPCAPR